MEFNRTYKLHWSIGLLLLLVVVAILLGTAVVAFYFLPKMIVFGANFLLSFLGWHIPFNLLTWAEAMYFLHVIGVVRIVVRELKSSIVLTKKAQ